MSFTSRKNGRIACGFINRPTTNIIEKLDNLKEVYVLVDNVKCNIVGIFDNEVLAKTNGEKYTNNNYKIYTFMINTVEDKSNINVVFN